MAEKKSDPTDSEVVTTSVPGEPETPKPVSSLDLETSERSKRFLKASIGPAVMGLIAAALLVGVVALYTWGSNVSSNSTNDSGLAQGWAGVLPIAAIIVGLVVGIGLPVLWAYKKGVKHVIVVLTFEGLALLLALLVSGFFLFNSSQTGGSAPTPVGCGCNSPLTNGPSSNICTYCAN